MSNGEPPVPTEPDEIDYDGLPYPPDFEDLIDGYTYQDAQILDPQARMIIGIWVDLDKELPSYEIQAMINSLILEGGLVEFAQEIETARAFFMLPEELPDNIRLKPMPSAIDGIDYLEGIGGWQGFSGLTWINGTWYVWIGDTNGREK